MAIFQVPYNPQLDPMAQLANSLGGLADRRLLGNELQQLQGLAPGAAMPNFKSPGLQNLQLQALMQSRMPMTPYQTATLGIQQQQADTAQTRAEQEALGNFTTIDYWIDGKKRSSRVPDAMYGKAVDQIVKSGGMLDDPVDVRNKVDIIEQRQAAERRAEEAERRAQFAETRTEAEELRRVAAEARAEAEEIRKGAAERRAESKDRREELAAAKKRLQLTDIGERKGVFDPETGRVTPTEHPSAKTPSTQINVKQPPAKMLDDLGDLYDMQDQVVDMAGLFDEKETFWAGKWENFKAKHGLKDLPYIGNVVKAPKERGIMFRQIAETLKEDLARKRSGGQITASEFVRLDRLLPDWKSPPETFKSKLKGFAQALDRTVKSKRRVLGEAGYIVPGETQVQGPKSVSTGGQQAVPTQAQGPTPTNTGGQQAIPGGPILLPEVGNAIARARRMLPPAATDQEVKDLARQLIIEVREKKAKMFGPEATARRRGKK
ncbi:MAG: hypothetical protein ACYSWQ_12300 [Planctomycetota bacterium]|jgi:hypothetical protein